MENPTYVSSMVEQPASTAQSTTSALYDGVATIGRIRSYISIVVAHLILIPTMQVPPCNEGLSGDMILGFWLLFRRQSLTASAQGVVVDPPVCGQPPNEASCNVLPGHVL